MLIAILPYLLKFVLELGALFGLAFMVVCTVFVVICIIHGDIKINIISDKDKKEGKQ